jgi:hypothetical protein
MEEVYDFFKSDNFYIELYREIMPFLMALFFLSFYIRKKINIIELLLIGISTETFTAITLGPTFSASLFISYYILLTEFLFALKGKLAFQKKYLFLFFLPLISSLGVFIMVANNDIFQYPTGRLSFYLKPVYFYIKNYLPVFAIGSAIFRERDELSFSNLKAIVQKIATFSLCIALLQIFVVYAFRVHEIGEIVGLQKRYLVQHQNDFFKLRLQALFKEPKKYSSFLALVIPIFWYEKKYFLALVSVVLASLTLSQTFWVNFLCMVILFLFFAKVKSFRIKIIGTLSLMIALFLMVDSSKDFFVNKYMENQDNFFYKLIASRAVERLDLNDLDNENSPLGIPLQKDLELPVYNFFCDHPQFLLFGYGPGNSPFINAEYFFHVSNYEARLKGVGANNMDMRWFFIFSEFGLIAFILYFVILTRVDKRIPAFQCNYFAFVWVCMFFSEIDVIWVIGIIFCQYNIGELPNSIKFKEPIALA